ncbi:N-acetyl sugar amidotransferase [Halomonas sp. DQ26W]|uniref:N-acetyl sugar amidotransferase n=1 Tax=Halomonas sp. DQ26W TaxID=2282311 RepID=UPI000DF7A10E|nr:N-acetyl sugar amidotransferase [Halomonas sp. DQ26W]RDB42165.1 N-acetyl sugar amidotransferase [Halomonas sp. DQ26W]
MASTNHQICIRCVMDTTAKDIRFDEDGICNYCTYFENHVNDVVFESEEERSVRRKQFIKEVKAAGKRKPYDCVMGLSGGVDSSYALHLALQEGLRPLAVHMDNNWNSELATNNIKNLVSGLNVDLHTHVINWPEYRNLMQSFFDADVIDVELLYDNAMLAVNYNQARKYGIKYILSGSNSATEGMPMPQDWNWKKWDKKNIKALGKRGGVKVKTFPSIGIVDYLINRLVYGIQWVPYLDYYDYQKTKAMDLLEEKYNYKRYPYKHYESVFTRFYQGYILPEKFDVDKRKLHLATLVMSNQISREEALKILESSPYPTEKELHTDKKYFLKKMGWTEQTLELYLRREPRAHDEYPSSVILWEFMRKLYKAYK